MLTMCFAELRKLTHQTKDNTACISCDLLFEDVVDCFCSLTAGIMRQVAAGALAVCWPADPLHE